MKRPALNLGVQFEYLNEIKNIKKTTTKDDVKVVYPDIILDGHGEEKKEILSMPLFWTSSQIFQVSARTRPRTV